MSKGENKIEKILKENNINYQKEFSFPGLVGYKNVPLRYDFVIFDFFGKVRYIIEYDGEGHFNKIDYFTKSKKEFNHRLEMDRRKNKYALVNNIPLVRIPYWDLEKITFETIFNNINYRVKSIYHNDIINPNKR